MSTSPDTMYFQDGSYLKYDPILGAWGFYQKNGTLNFYVTKAGNISANGKFTTYNNTGLAGWGLPAILAYNSGLAKTAAVTNLINFTPPGEGGRYRVGVTVNVSAWATPASFQIQVKYQDENSTPQTDIMNVTQGSVGSSIATGAITAVDRWYAIPIIIVTDNSETPIQVSTVGTFTGSITYDIYAYLERIA